MCWMWMHVEVEEVLTSPGGFPNIEAGFECDMRGTYEGAVDGLEDKFGGCLAHFGQGLGDGREVGFYDQGRAGFGESYHGNVIRDAQTAPFDLLHGSDGHWIVECEDGVGADSGIQHPADGRYSVFPIDACFDDELLPGFQVVLSQRLQVTRFAFLGQRELCRTGKMGDVLVSGVYQMFNGPE